MDLRREISARCESAQMFGASALCGFAHWLSLLSDVSWWGGNWQDAGRMIGGFSSLCFSMTVML